MKTRYKLIKQLAEALSAVHETISNGLQLLKHDNAGQRNIECSRKENIITEYHLFASMGHTLTQRHIAHFEEVKK